MAVALGVDGTTQVNAALVNQFIAAGAGGKTGTALFWARIRYNGSAWEVHASTDSAAIITANLAFVTDHLEVTLTNFTVAPCPIVAPYMGDSIYLPKIAAISSTKVHIAWYSAITTRVTTPDVNMDCYVHIVGA